MWETVPCGAFGTRLGHPQPQGFRTAQGKTEVMMLYDKRWEQSADTKRKRKTWRDILMRAADIIEQGGWCQQEYYTNKGSHCAIGALSKANGYRYTVAYGIAVGKLEREI